MAEGFNSARRAARVEEGKPPLGRVQSVRQNRRVLECYDAAVNPDDVRSFAARDWALVEQAKRRYWTARKERRGFNLPGGPRPTK